MKKILVALDYGLSAKKIAKKALQLSQSLKANVTLLHVVTDINYYNMVDSAPFIGYGIGYFNIDDSKNLIESSEKFLEKIKIYLKDTSIKILAKQGDIATVILETATKGRFDLIVIGSHSHNWLEKTVIGSVTESVLDQSKIPMLVIPIKEDK